MATWLEFRRVLFRSRSYIFNKPDIAHRYFSWHAPYLSTWPWNHHSWRSRWPFIRRAYHWTFWKTGSRPCALLRSRQSCRTRAWSRFIFSWSGNNRWSRISRSHPNRRPQTRFRRYFNHHHAGYYWLFNRKEDFQTKYCSLPRRPLWWHDKYTRTRRTQPTD